MNKLILYKDVLYKIVPRHPQFAVSQYGHVLTTSGPVLPEYDNKGLPFIRFSPSAYNYLNRLVLGTWLGKNLFRSKVSHIDGDVNNCLITNLSSYTKSGIHKVSGLVTKDNLGKYTLLARPTRSVPLTKRHKLSEVQVEEIMALIDSDSMSQADIAEEYGVCRATINRIANKRTWKWKI